MFYPKCPTFIQSKCTTFSKISNRCTCHCLEYDNEHENTLCICCPLEFRSLYKDLFEARKDKILYERLLVVYQL